VAGGLDPATSWSRSGEGLSPQGTIIAGPSSGVLVTAGAGGLWYLSIVGANAPKVADAGSTSPDAYGLIVDNSPSFTMHVVTISAGNGADGHDGVGGANWSDAGVDAGGDAGPRLQPGAAGESAGTGGSPYTSGGQVPKDGGLGANAGETPTPPAGIGGSGMRCIGPVPGGFLPPTAIDPTSGLAPDGGTAGSAGSFQGPGPTSTPLAPGYIACGGYEVGSDTPVPLGSPGAAGAIGPSGAPGAAKVWTDAYDGGAFSTGPFAWDGGFIDNGAPRGGRGGYGAPGGGGGGCCGNSDTAQILAFSGGGGSGGNGGYGGYGAGAGGSSVALVVVSPGADSVFPACDHVTLKAQVAGVGGRGGPGGTGAPGGLGGQVGDAASTTPGTTWQAGGNGGAGGTGGGGAGGLGGNSIAFLYVGAGGPAKIPVEAGVEAQGGLSGPGGNSGTPNGLHGAAGISSPYLWLTRH